MVERVPPQNIEAEQSLLGSLLIDPDAMTKVADTTASEDFYLEKHRAIYEAMVELFAKHQPIDLLSTANALEERSALERVGGRAYLVQLSSQVPSATHIHHYAEIVTKKATLRRLIAAAGDVLGLGYEESEDVEKLLDEAEQRLFHVSRKYQHTTFTPLSSVLTDAFERIDALHKDKGKLRGIASGFSDIDMLLAGFQASDLVILAARPSVGKTSLALDVARHVATALTIPVGVFSLEMSKEQVVDRLICAQSGIDLWKLRTGRLSDRREEGGMSDFDRLREGLNELSQAPIYIDDAASATVMEIRAKARRLKAEHNLGLLIVDYLQLMEGRSRIDNRVQEVAEITRGLKAIARELSIPVVALSQLSRAVEQRGGPAIPKLADLRESGSIEQDADVVLFIYRKSADRGVKEVNPQERHLAEIHVAKHRNGPTGVVELFFDEQRASFKNLERKHTPLDVPF